MDRAAIETCFRGFAACVGGAAPIEAASQADLDFHLAIIHASHNGLFITVGGALKSALRVSSRMLARHAAAPVEDLALHDGVRAAIFDRDPEAAFRAMTGLLEAARARVLPYATGTVP